jgi:hypothetical protein
MSMYCLSTLSGLLLDTRNSEIERTRISEPLNFRVADRESELVPPFRRLRGFMRDRWFDQPWGQAFASGRFINLASAGQRELERSNE